MSSGNPVSNKVSLGTLGGGALGIVTSLLVYYIPAWHNGLPGYVALIVPVLMTLIGHFASGYGAKHKANADEIERAIHEAESLLELLPPGILPSPPLPAGEGLVAAHEGGPEPAPEPAAMLTLAHEGGPEPLPPDSAIPPPHPTPDLGGAVAAE